MLIDTVIILLIIGLALSFLLSISLGANDAATPTDCAVGAGVISIKKALLLFAVFTLIGATMQGFMVIKTIGKGMVNEIEIVGAISISISTSIWVLYCSYKGLDVSVTHSTIGSVAGYGLTAYGLSGLNYDVVKNVIISWVTSPICAIALSYILYKLAMRILMNKPWTYRLEKVISYILIFSLCFSAYSFGANDVGNATGAYVTVAMKVGRMPDYNTMMFLSILGAVGIAIGGLFFGKNVINTVAFKITKIDMVMGMIAEISNALIVYLFTTIPYMIFGFGMPISTSIASNSSIIGVGLAKDYKAVNYKTVLKLVVGWISTLPMTMLITAIIYTTLKIIIGGSLI
ncbi:MAG: inorganic phosphate transporter [Candidatus Methanomethylicia archaeon]